MDGDILGAVVAVGVDEEGEWGGGRGVGEEEKGEGNWRTLKVRPKLMGNQSPACRRPASLPANFQL